MRVLKSLYRLKQAARLWYILLKKFLEEMGFKAIPWDDTIFINEKTGVIIRAHVDDMLLTGDEDAIKQVKEQVRGRFEMKDLGEANYLLGIQGTHRASNTSKIKHIDIAHHHIIDKVKKGTIKTYWVPGEHMLADEMIKPLPRDSFERNRAAIGIREVV